MPDAHHASFSACSRQEFPCLHEIQHPMEHSPSPGAKSRPLRIHFAGGGTGGYVCGPVLAAMAAACRKLGHPDAAARIVGFIEELAGLHLPLQ